MKVLIIEDEELAADRLKRMILKIDGSINITGVTESIASTVDWLHNNGAPDLIFADIHLADGHSFEIFNQVEPPCPIIFTTAYDQYAMKAFKFNSIDYLLKPIKKAELEDSLQKFKKTQVKVPAEYGKLLEALQSSTKTGYQKRIVIRYGQKIKMVEIADVAYFYTEEKVTFACTNDNYRLPVDNNLDELESILDPSLFFRINRQYIVNIEAIENMHSYSKSRVKLDLKPNASSETIVSTDRSPGFKEWLLGKE